MYVPDSLAPGGYVVSPGVRASGILERHSIENRGWKPMEVLSHALHATGLRCEGRGGRLWILTGDEQ